MDEELTILPDNFRVAIKEDFIHMGKIQDKQQYYIQSYYTNHYELYTIHKDWFDMDRLQPWLNDKRCFVDKNNNAFNRPDKNKKVEAKEEPKNNIPIKKLSLDLEL